MQDWKCYGTFGIWCHLQDKIFSIFWRVKLWAAGILVILPIEFSCWPSSNKRTDDVHSKYKTLRHPNSISWAWIWTQGCFIFALLRSAGRWKLVFEKNANVKHPINGHTGKAQKWSHIEVQTSNLIILYWGAETQIPPWTQPMVWVYNITLRKLS